MLKYNRRFKDMINITEDNFDMEVEKADRLCVIDLYADWCGPCRALSRIFDSLEADNPDVKFCKINIDEQPKLAEMFRVTSIPLVAFVKGGTYLDMSVGLVPRSAFEKMIEEYK